jgi:hypothetical protein
MGTLNCGLWSVSAVPWKRKHPPGHGAGGRFGKVEWALEDFTATSTGDRGTTGAEYDPAGDYRTRGRTSPPNITTNAARSASSRTIDSRRLPRATCPGVASAKTDAVVHRPGILDPQLPCHAPFLSQSLSTSWQAENFKILTDPLADPLAP